MSERAPISLLSCGEGADLASSVAARLGVPLTPSRDVWFACGEAKHVIDANVRGGDVWIFQRAYAPGGRSVYDRWMMLLHAADAARHADADRVNVVLPYLPGSRQDKRKLRSREGVSTGLFARMLEAAGVSMILTVEPHNEAMIGCYDPSRTILEPIFLSHPFGQHLARSKFPIDVVASADVGGLESARRYAIDLHKGIVALSKERDYRRPNTVARTEVIGEVSGADVLIVEDIVDSGGSAASAVRALWSHGARHVTLAAAHCLMSADAWARLQTVREEGLASGREFRLVGTHSVLHPNAPEWYSSFDFSELISKVVRACNRRGSVRRMVEEA